MSVPREVVIWDTYHYAPDGEPVCGTLLPSETRLELLGEEDFFLQESNLLEDLEDFLRLPRSKHGDRRCCACLGKVGAFFDPEKHHYSIQRFGRPICGAPRGPIFYKLEDWIERPAAKCQACAIVVGFLATLFFHTR